LIAVTGLPGEGKTRLLAEFAARQAALGTRVEGFLAAAGPRERPDQGATEYRLTLLATGEERTWAIRDDRLTPPYHFDQGTFARLARWAVMLERHHPLVLMDEFSVFESRGKGLMPLWPAVADAEPRIIVMAVRAGLTGAIEEKLGRKFDVHVSATAPDAMDRLLSACADYGEWTRIGLYGGAAGGLEMSVGSALHAVRAPLRGLAMSSLQSIMMTLTGCGLTEPARVVWVPFISAGLKALSPAGNRLRPMIAIAAQGLLYGLSVLVLGWNAVGVTLGGALVGSWAALQDFFLQYLLLGGDLLLAYSSMTAWVQGHWHVTPPSLPWLVGLWTLFHALIAGSLTFVTWRRRAPPTLLQRIIARESPVSPVVSPAPSRARRIIREFLRWQFWLPLVAVSLVLLATGRRWEAVAWLALRFVAVGAVILALVSLLQPARLADALHRRGWWGPALAVRSALARRTEATRRHPPA
jgi:nucleoside-triphosphatase THEP1